LIFELEILRKATARFTNPRCHPGRHNRTPIVAQDFAEPLAPNAQGFKRICVLVGCFANACLPIVDTVEMLRVLRRTMHAIHPVERMCFQMVTTPQAMA